MEKFTLGLHELSKLCDKLPKEGILLLRGDLAMGKTTLVKAIAKSLCINEDITSPTFSVMCDYENKLYHYDIYQEKTNGFIKQGLYENLSKKGLHVVEWGDEEFESLLQKMGYEYVCIDICKANESNKRNYEVKYA